ncbi:I66 family serine proteinase inhibitor [Streptomyces sp. NPDC059534]|uniref:I66 family serine proteinase inhibitor n=1 Tax=Streptomyces sp. NPDC059534 TaxID=3346859 RepID=UPI0036CFBEFF
MSDIGKVVKLYAKGAPVGVEGGALVGFLVDQGRAGEWLVTRAHEGFRFTSKGTEETIASASTDRAPVVVRPDDSAASVWRIQHVTDDGTTTVTSLADLRTGTYVIDQQGLALGRDLFEDRSLLPKRVFVRTDDRDPQWTIEVL